MAGVGCPLKEGAIEVPFETDQVNPLGAACVQDILLNNASLSLYTYRAKTHTYTHPKPVALTMSLLSVQSFGGCSVLVENSPHGTVATDTPSDAPPVPERLGIMMRL